MRLQPGVQRILEELDVQDNILDLGCGNGELWRALASSGHMGHYVGLDFSQELLKIARETDDHMPNSSVPRTVFLQADISDIDWHNDLPETDFNVILAFAVLHHLPGQALHLRTLRQVRELLPEGGVFYHSVWQFLNSERLRNRIQPWEAAGLTEEQVDPGDYLLDWRQGGYGLRYIHHFEEQEFAVLAKESDFKIVDSYYSDGQGGRLGLYQAWVPL